MQKENKFLIPVAIVIAGILIAGAVVFKGKASPAAVNTDPEVQEPQDIKLASLSAEDHVLGNPNAPITIFEFSDIDCPFCAGFHTTMHRIMDEYGKDGKVAWVYRHFPLDQLHPEARTKAESSECIATLANNDTFWRYLDILFERTETLADIQTIAAEVGVDSAAFKACVDSKQYKDKVQADLDEAIAAGGRGTPYSVLVTKSGEKFPINGAQPYEIIKQVIDTALLEQ